MLIRYLNAEIQIVSLVNFTLISQRSFVPSLASVTKSAVVGHFLSLREPTIKVLSRINCIKSNTISFNFQAGPKNKFQLSPPKHVLFRGTDRW